MFGGVLFHHQGVVVYFEFILQLLFFFVIIVCGLQAAWTAWGWWSFLVVPLVVIAFCLLFALALFVLVELPSRYLSRYRILAYLERQERSVLPWVIAHELDLDEGRVDRVVDQLLDQGLRRIRMSNKITDQRQLLEFIKDLEMKVRDRLVAISAPHDTIGSSVVLAHLMPAFKHTIADLREQILDAEDKERACPPGPRTFL